MSATGRRGAARDVGATLIEMLVVIGILGLVTAMIFPAWTAPLRRAQLYEARAALVSNLRTARAQSVRGGAEVTLEVADNGRGYGWGPSQVFLPGEVAINGAKVITFYADGSSTGGALKLTERAQTLSVAVDPGTGLVRDAGG
jgi:general secretion pathway protein H